MIFKEDEIFDLEEKTQISPNMSRSLDKSLDYESKMLKVIRSKKKRREKVRSSIESSLFSDQKL